MIQGLWEAGQLSMIHTYCRQDVIQTYGLFLRIELMRGRLPLEVVGRGHPLSRRALRDAWESPDSGEYGVDTSEMQEGTGKDAQPAPES